MSDARTARDVLAEWLAQYPKRISPLPRLPLRGGIAQEMWP
jgi:hypothetical protein